MNPNTRTSLSRFLRQRGGYALALGGLAVSIQVACSDQPSNGSTYAPVAGTPATTAGTPATTAGTGGATAGTFSTGGSTAGTFATGGGGSGGGGTGGDTTAGMSGGGTAGSTSAGMAGTGGQVVLTPYCMDKTPSALPYTVNEGFQLSGWNQGAVDQAIANDAIMNPANTDCMNRLPGAVGTCSTWRYTAKLASGYAYVQWITKWDNMYTHPPVCIDPAAKAVSFAAKGGKGGEKVTFAAGGGMQDKEITLTSKWEHYFVPLDGVDFNTFDAGVVEGFEWKIVPTADAPAIDFAIDDIKWVKDLPVDGAGGAGGATM